MQLIHCLVVKHWCHLCRLWAPSSCGLDGMASTLAAQVPPSCVALEQPGTLYAFSRKDCSECGILSLAAW